MTYESFQHWLDAYGRAWETRDPQAAAQLFAEAATYQETPFDEPLRGRAAIVAYWSEVPRTQEQIRFGHKILSTKEHTGIAHWWASFVRLPAKSPVALNGIFVVTFDANGQCVEFREWWHRQEERATA